MDELLSIAVSNAVAATVLALVAIGVSMICRRPALVHGLWLLVLLKLVTPPLLLIPVSWPNAGELSFQETAPMPEEALVTLPVTEEKQEVVANVPVTDEAGVASAPREEALGALTPPRPPELGAPQSHSSVVLWPELLSIVWGLGALAWFVLALERLHRFRRLLRFARPASAALQERTRGLASSLGVKRCPRVRLLPGRIAPMLWAGGGPPRLLVPAELLDLLNEEQLDTLLLHELAHLRRRDHWVRILEFVVLGCYWWHPVVWYARRELREAEEQCCDAWVVSTLPEAGRTYASALLDTLDFLSTAQTAVPPLATGLSQIADLKRRLTMIMRGNTPCSLTWPGCIAVLALGMTVLPMLPSLRAQVPGKEERSSTSSVEEDARRALDRAQAELQQQMALLKQQQALVKRAEEHLRKAALEKAHQQKLENERMRQLAASEAVQANSKRNQGEDRKTVTYRIEITLSPGDMPPEKIVKEIQKELAEKFPYKIQVHSVTVRHNERVAVTVPGAAPAPGVELRLVPSVNPGAGSLPDQRINDLEKKLEKVLQELHDLRKQMKQSSAHPAIVPSTIYRAVPAPAAPSGETPRPTPTPPLVPHSYDNPYEAPTVPLAPTPAQPGRP